LNLLFDENVTIEMEKSRKGISNEEEVRKRK